MNAENVMQIYTLAKWLWLKNDPRHLWASIVRWFR